ncbi:P-loop containing nucleoside triphosphate hydrolase protein [Phycomyces nitens]|nr:P-loop containing nucleoside triphosphate hydrolase protein [Phycomyces nitens]
MYTIHSESLKMLSQRLNVVHRFTSTNTSKSTRFYTKPSFQQLGISNTLCTKLHSEFNIESPTKAQSMFIPPILQGRDLFIRDRTGTGKSFGIALALSTLDKQTPSPKTTQSLYIVPNQELAVQIGSWLQRLLPAVPSTSLIESNVFRTSNTVVGTPGHLLELIQQGHLGLNGLDSIILDEADQALRLPKRYASLRDQQRRAQHPKPAQILIESIFENLPMDLEKPQLVVSSATLNRPIRHWLTQRQWMDDPVFVDITEGTQLDDDAENPTVSHHCLLLSEDTIRNIKPFEDSQEAGEVERPVADFEDNDDRMLENIAVLKQVEDVRNGILFVGALTSTADIKRRLAVHEVEAKDIREYIPGQPISPNTLWIANEFSARGMDIPDVSHVFILGKPSSVAAYLHMAGRTGRLSPKGFGQGKVFSIVRDDGRMESSMQTMYNLINVPVKQYEHVE